MSKPSPQEANQQSGDDSNEQDQGLICDLSAKPAARQGGAGADDEHNQGEKDQDQAYRAAVQFSGIQAEVANEVFHLIAPYWI